MADAKILDIHRYWFGELEQTPEYFEERNALWFGGTPKIDAEIRERFGADRDRAARGEVDAWRATPRGAMALILLLDQFSLNLYREKPESYRGCDLALAVSREAIDRGWEWLYTPAERVFLYLPFEHSENIPDQERSVALFEGLARGAPSTHAKVIEGYADYARRHARVVKKFGRFPDRNEVFGRVSTPEEVTFLASDEAPF